MKSWLSRWFEAGFEARDAGETPAIRSYIAHWFIQTFRLDVW